MRKVTSLVLAGMLAVSVALPASAAGAGFGPAATLSTGDVTEGGQPPARTFDADRAQRLAAERGRGEVSAQVSVPLTVDAWAMYQYGSSWYIDGIVSLPIGAPSNVAGMLVTVEYHDAADVVIDSTQVYTYGWVLAPGDGTTFSLDAFDPGTGHFDVSAVAWETAVAPVFLDLALVDGQIVPSGERVYTLTLTNNNPFTVVGAEVNGFERFSATNPPVDFWDITISDPHQQRLAPGEAVTVYTAGYRIPSVSGYYGYWVGAEAVRAPLTDVVYRFFNKRTGTHFYTIDPGERDNVIANLGWLYNYEGGAYQSYAAEEISTIPLFRFYNVRTGTHFYTADPDERDAVIDALGWLYNYEGEAFFICDSGGLATNDMFRFYNRATGTHFYTADPGERDNVIANLAWLYTYEGPAFSVPKP